MFFEDVEEAPVDPIFGLTAAFNADLRATKINLSVGVYKTADLKTPMLESVKAAEKHLLEVEKTKDYLPIDGLKSYLDRVGELVFGDFWRSKKECVSAIQTIGGTGALRIGGDFLRKEVSDRLYLSEPTWPNHRAVFTKCGFKLDFYPYYDRERKSVDFERMKDFLNDLEPKSVVILHACCHNPTGFDLTLDQWRQLSELFFSKQLFPFFDFAYQGFDRSLEEDAAVVRLFAEAGHEMLVASSYSKNFTLYSERVGALFAIANSEKTAKHLTSQLKILVRTTYSNPPRHGAEVVATILGDRSLREQWELELTKMRERIAEMRYAFARALIAKNPRFLFLEASKGLFSFCGLEKTQVDRITKEFGIYMTNDGRINVAGLNWDNLDYVVNAIISVTI